MAKLPIAVDGMELEFVNSNHSGDITIAGVPSTKVKAENKGVYKATLAITIANGSDGSGITNATGAGVMLAIGIKTKADGLFVLRQNDISVPITMTGTNPSPPPPTSTYVTVVRIKDANQTKVLSE